jgi:hypothetical protein
VRTLLCIFRLPFSRKRHLCGPHPALTVYVFGFRLTGVFRVFALPARLCSGPAIQRPRTPYACAQSALCCAGPASAPHVQAFACGESHPATHVLRSLHFVWSSPAACSTLERLCLVGRFPLPPCACRGVSPGPVTSPACHAGSVAQAPIKTDSALLLFRDRSGLTASTVGPFAPVAHPGLGRGKLRLSAPCQNVRPLSAPPPRGPHRADFARWARARDWSTRSGSCGGCTLPPMPTPDFGVSGALGACAGVRLSLRKARLSVSPSVHCGLTGSTGAGGLSFSIVRVLHYPGA